MAVFAASWRAGAAALFRNAGLSTGAMAVVQALHTDVAGVTYIAAANCVIDAVATSFDADAQ